jgi:hypothetical protein
MFQDTNLEFAWENGEKPQKLSSQGSLSPDRDLNGQLSNASLSFTAWYE